MIVGGGPAGVSTALHLVRRGRVDPRRILVIDRAKFPREKPCAGAVSELGIDALAAIGVPIEVPKLPMNGLRVLERDAVGETVAPIGIVVRRSELDAELLDRVRRDGVEVRDGEGLVSIERTPDGFRLRTTNGEITTRFIAACDGAGSTTRKLLGLKEPERKGHLYVLETEAQPTDTGCARGLVDFDLTLRGGDFQGYYWDFPTPIGNSPHVSRGIYHANLTPCSDVKPALARALAQRGLDIADVKLKPFSTRPFVRDSQTSVEGVVLVGEAVGIDRATGEGIAQAIVMGEIAARHLRKAMKTGARTFPAYDREVKTSTIGRHMLQSAFLAKRVFGSRRFGLVARRYLLGSTYARHAAIDWYRGRKLSAFTKLRLGMGLAASSV